MSTLRLNAAAALLGISPITLRKRACAGTVPGYKPGKAWVFLEDELMDYLKSTRKCPSIAAQIRPTGGFGSSLMAEKSAFHLVQRIAAKRRNLKLSRETTPTGTSGSVSVLL